MRDNIAEHCAETLHLLFRFLLQLYPQTWCSLLPVFQLPWGGRGRARKCSSTSTRCYNYSSDNYSSGGRSQRQESYGSPPFLFSSTRNFSIETFLNPQPLLLSWCLSICLSFLLHKICDLRFMTSHVLVRRKIPRSAIRSRALQRRSADTPTTVEKLPPGWIMVCQRWFKLAQCFFNSNWLNVFFLTNLFNFLWIHVNPSGNCWDQWIELIHIHLGLVLHLDSWSVSPWSALALQEVPFCFYCKRFPASKVEKSQGTLCDMRGKVIFLPPWLQIHCGAGSA